MKVRRFNDSTYNTDFILMWGGTAAQLNKAVVKKYDKTFDMADTDYLARCFEFVRSRRHTIVIMLTNWRGSRDAVGVSSLAHEIFHATEYVMKYRDIPHSEDTSEAWAYYFDSIFQRCLEILNSY